MAAQASIDETCALRRRRSRAAVCRALRARLALAMDGILGTDDWRHAAAPARILRIEAGAVARNGSRMLLIGRAGNPALHRGRAARLDGPALLDEIGRAWVVADHALAVAEHASASGDAHREYPHLVAALRHALAVEHLAGRLVRLVSVTEATAA